MTLEIYPSFLSHLNLQFFWINHSQPTSLQMMIQTTDNCLWYGTWPWQYKLIHPMIYLIPRFPYKISRLHNDWQGRFGLVIPRGWIGQNRVWCASIDCQIMLLISSLLCIIVTQYFPYSRLRLIMIHWITHWSEYFLADGWPKAIFMTMIIIALTY